MNQRQEVLDRLDFQNTKCPECGLRNNCQIEAGKSISACWCFGEIPKEGSGFSETCFCRTCLKNRRTQ